MIRPAEALLRLTSLLVPGDRRAGWLREWRGELAVGSGRGGPAVLAAALEDALVLRLRALSVGSTVADLRFALRTLRRSRGFTVAVVLTLGLGVGANVAIFSAVRAVLLRPFTWDRPEGIALVSLAFGGGADATPFPASEPEYYQLRDEDPAFRDLAAYFLSDMNVGALDEPLRTGVAGVTANFLDVLGVEVALGRDFAPGEDGPDSPGLAILGDGFWARAYGRDPEVLGSTVLLDERPYTVVGILPPAFVFPGAGIDILRNLSLDPAAPGSWSSHWLSMVARLADDTDVAAARVRTRGLVDRWSRAFPGRHGPSNDHHPVRVRGLRKALTGDLDRPLLLLSVAVGLVLLVACLNVANLLLVRGDDRRRELGVRTALGAGRATLLRQLLVETSVLAVVGGAVGTGVAALALGALPAYATELLPPNTVVTMDGSVLLFALAVTGVSALVFGLLPGWSATSRDVAASLREGGGRSGTGVGSMAARRLLVVAEVALAVVLVATAGVLGRGFLRLLAVDPGFDPDGVVVMDFQLTSGTYPDGASVAAFHDELRQRVEALPGVVRAAAIRTLPTLAGGGVESLELLGRTPPSEDEGGWPWTVRYQVADPGIFESLGVPVVEGRSLAVTDDAGSPPVAVLNEAAARRLYGGDDPLGQRLRLGNFPDNPNPVMTVVGVVGDVRQDGLDQAAPPQLYVTRSQAAAVYDGLGTRFATLVVRASTPPDATLPAVRGVLRDLDPALPVTGMRSLRDQVGRSVGDRRLLALLMAAFSVAGLILGGVGLYGLLAYIVARRAREIGIRFALGADRGSVVGRVVGEGLALVAGGAVVGVAGALAGGGLLQGLVYGVSARDPVALVGAPALLMAVGILASWLPARRASHVDPARVLRSE